jgi:hypothetical protein
VARIEDTFPDPDLPPVARILALARNRVRVLGSDSGLAWLLRSEQAYLTLPQDAVQRLRDVVTRSRQFLLAALRDGATGGVIRGDIEPEILLVPVLGTIHAVIGLQAAQGKSSRKQMQQPERVLLALQRLLEPPGSAITARPRPTDSSVSQTFKKES